MDLDVTVKKNILIGLMVDIQVSSNKNNEEYIRGRVKRVISNKDCKKGIKVELTTGAIGHIKYVPHKHEIKKDNFKFYNEFFYSPIYILWEKKSKEYFTFTRVNSLTNEEENTLMLFTSKELAEEFIKKSNLLNVSIRILKRNKPINTVLKDYKIDKYSINGNKKLSYDKMQVFEDYFKRY